MLLKCPQYGNNILYLMKNEIQLQTLAFYHQSYLLAQQEQTRKGQLFGQKYTIPQKEIKKSFDLFSDLKFLNVSASNKLKMRINHKTLYQPSSQQTLLDDPKEEVQQPKSDFQELALKQSPPQPQSTFKINKISKFNFTIRSDHKKQQVHQKKLNLHNNQKSLTVKTLGLDGLLQDVKRTHASIIEDAQPEIVFPEKQIIAFRRLNSAYQGTKKDQKAKIFCQKESSQDIKKDNASEKNQDEPKPRKSKSDQCLVSHTVIVAKQVTNQNGVSPKQDQKLQDSSQEKNQLFLKKLVLYREFLLVLNYSNQVNVQPGYMYKAFITKGNNGQIVRNCLKTRWWWTLTEKSNNIEELNLSWTQTRKPQYLEHIASQQFQEQQRLCFDVEEEKRKGESWDPVKKIIDKRRLDEIGIVKGNQSYFHGPIRKDEEIKNTLGEGNENLVENAQKLRCHNHLEQNYLICNKKALYYTLKSYYETINKNPFDYIPKTFHIQNGGQDSVFKEFEEYFLKKENNFWIIKPGENSNRGQGIQLSDNLKDIEKLINEKRINKSGSETTYIDIFSIGVHHQSIALQQKEI